MQEHHVTVAGQRRDLPVPFHVLATQNPIEQEGTYPLPEAQLDRFLLQVDVPYPGRAAEREILLATTGVADIPVAPVLDGTGLITAQEAVRRMPLGDSILEAILDLVRAARPDDNADELVRRTVSWGPGPRAAQALSLAVRARALLEGRMAPTIIDVEALARPVLIHRMALGFAARAEGVTLDSVIADLVAEAASRSAAA